MMFFFGPFFLFLPLVLFAVTARVLLGMFSRVFRDPARLEKLRPGLERRALESRRARGRLESRVFGLAYRLGGRVTVSDVVLETGLGLKAAEELLNRMTDEVRVRMTVDDRGLVVYEFPEIIDRLARENS